MGMISRPVGVRGQVRIRHYTDSPESFVRHPRFFLRDGLCVVLRSPRINEKSEIISRLEGYSDRNSVEPLCQQELFLRRDDLPPLEMGEYYLEDLKDLDVLNSRGEYVGRVYCAQDFGAGAFLEIGISQEDSKIATLPFNKSSVLSIDLEKGFVVIDKSFLLT